MIHNLKKRFKMAINALPLTYLVLHTKWFYEVRLMI